MPHLPIRVLYYGKAEPLSEQTELRAGPLSLCFEAGDLRYICLGDREILRRVYVAVRDRNWGTVPVALSHLQIQRADDAFHIAYDVENKQGDIDFFWKGVITGDRDGAIRFEMQGEARSTFLRNRIGFCVLHPIRECAGQPCRVEKVDGTVETGVFPRYISPHQPFMDMVAIAHEVAPGVEAEVRFQGDIFEMEDQRNWTDASYKTYCTPLSKPFPVEVKKGTKISQSATLTLKGRKTGASFPHRFAAQPRTDLVFTVAETPSGDDYRGAVDLPRIGLGVASHGRPLNAKEKARLRALNLAHLRVDLKLSRPDVESALRQATDEAQSIGASLEAALFLSDAAEAELSAFARLIERIKPPVAAYLIFHENEKSTTARWIEVARRYLPDAKIGSGTNAYFTELNRERPPIDRLDLVCYSINPQVHAFDNASLAEALEAQASTVESARQFINGLPLAVTPVTLRPRFNPDAAGPEPKPSPGETPAPVDARQMSLFGAGWTLGSLKYLSESGVSSATYYETTGWRGVMETENGSPALEKFRSFPGAVFPMYHVFADMGEFAGGKVAATVSSDALKIDGIALRKVVPLDKGDHRGSGDATRVMLANLTDRPLSVSVRNLSARVRVRHLNETNVEAAMQSPEAFRNQVGELTQTASGNLTVNLSPYAIVRIDNTV
jgi:hypothetical protein